MSFFWPKTRAVSLSDVGVRRRSGGSTRNLTAKKALQNDAVWAAVRLRADLISHLPVKTLRHYDSIGEAVPIALPEVLVSPAEWAPSHPMSMQDWLYATQVDLDLYGNAFGIIESVDGNNLPRVITPVSAADVTVTGKGMLITAYHVGDREYSPEQIWHERQYVQAGNPVGLSPIAFAAQQITTAESAAAFTHDWYDRGATPSMIVKNTKGRIDPAEADKIKRRVAASLQNGEPAVFGADWEITMQAARARDAAFLELHDHTTVAIARYFNVPANVIDAAVQGQNVTYSNLAQDMLRLLILHLAPTIKRRETNLSRLVGKRDIVKLNDGALLRLDPETGRRLLMEEVAAGIRTVNEVRALEDLPPLDLADASAEAGKAADIARLLQMGYLAVGKGITSDELRALANRLGANLPVPGPDFSVPDPNEGNPA